MQGGLISSASQVAGKLVGAFHVGQHSDLKLGDSKPSPLLTHVAFAPNGNDDQDAQQPLQSLRPGSGHKNKTCA